MEREQKGDGALANAGQ